MICFGKRWRPEGTRTIPTIPATEIRRVGWNQRNCLPKYRTAVFAKQEPASVEPHLSKRNPQRRLASHTSYASSATVGQFGVCVITIALLHLMHMQTSNLPYKEVLEKFLSDAVRQAGDPGASVRISDSGEFAIFSGEGDPKRRRLNEQGKQLMQTGSLAALIDYDSLFEP